MMKTGFLDLRDGLRPLAPDALTLSYQYYDDAQALDSLIDTVEGYSAMLKARLRILITDDHSHLYPVDAPARLDRLRRAGCFSVARIEHDKPWNQPGARNLNALRADTVWTLFTDIDHVFSEAALNEVLHRVRSGELCLSTVYRFDRTLANGERVAPHVNTYLLATNLYRRVGGVDEDFVGAYGCDDKHFVEELKVAGATFEVLHGCTVQVGCWKGGNELEGMNRDQEQNRALLQAKLTRGSFRSYLACRFGYRILC